MKSTSMTITLIALILTLVAPGLRASEEDGATPWRMSVSIGKLDTEGDADVDDALNASLRFERPVSRSLSLEGSLTVIPELEGNFYDDYSSGAAVKVNRLQEATGEEETWAAGVALDALYYLAPGKRLTPYLSAGLGLLRYGEEIGENNGLDITPRLGAGILQRLTDSLSLRVDFRYFVAGTVTKSESNFQIDFGLAWSPAARKTAQFPVTAAPEPAAEAPAAGQESATPAPATSATTSEPFELYIEFAGRSTAVEAQYFEQLDVIGRILKDTPAATALIEGHCDQHRNDNAQEAVELTRKRAEAVRDYLAGAKWRIARKRMEAVGCGFGKPKEQADLDKGNTANRRIVVTITRPVDSASQGTQR